MDLIPCSSFLPEATETRERRRFNSGLYLLANDEDFIGMGWLAKTAEGVEWRLQDGTVLPAGAVTRWDYLPDVKFWLQHAHEKEELMDADGYPTAHAIHLVENWSSLDGLGWMRFIERLWQHRWYGFHIEESPKGWRADVSTIGWSGNEAIIRSMQRNERLWEDLWQSTRRGGHYVFEEAYPDEDGMKPA